MIRFVVILVFWMILALSGCRSRPLIPTVTPSIKAPTLTYPAPPTSANTTSQTPTFLTPTAPTSAPPLVIVNPSSNRIERYNLLEINLQTILQVDNPYDPDEINIEVFFTTPSGDELKVGAFWMQDYDLQTRRPKGKPGWKVRITPTDAGIWSAVARIPDHGLESEAIRFQVVESNEPGFVRVHPSNPRYLAFDNGDFFFPIGLNICWWGGGLDPVAEYSKWLDLFTANGGNMIRVWMASWSFGIEWKDTGLGDYDERLYEAWTLDQLFSLADEHHVKIILVLMNHGPFSLSTNTEWKDNPYNAELGGPLASPDQFVTDPDARAYYQRRLNYIVNRWGYSTSLLAWEWFNEVNLTMIPYETLIPWLQEMTVYLRERDVNHHLTTNSSAIQAESPVWNMPEIDLIQKHEYAEQENAPDKDLAERVVADFNRLAMSAPIKPILLGEFGYSATNYGDDIETTGIHLHNGLWATTFAGYAGSGMYWWWDVYVDKYNLWKHFKGLSTFLEGVDLARYTSLSSVEIDGGGTDEAVGLGLQGEDILVWIRSNDYTVQASVSARNGSPDSASYVPPLVEGLRLTLKDMPDGNYTVRWFDPQGANWLDAQSVTAQNHTLIIPIPGFSKDLAAKISPNP
ncbi:MAG TPA: DUF5060 domain-containing protein [Anaerolineales bacterium]|nr:DUF5060 domain-containing protein [Anaerolineales bacterium]